MGFIPIILLTIIGLGLLAAVKPPDDQKPAPLAVLAMAFWIGVVAATVLIIVPAAVTGRMFFVLIYVLLAAAVALLVRFRKNAAWLLGAEALPTQSRAHVLMLLVCIPFVAIMAMNIVEGFSIGTSYGLAAFDPIGNFALKARLWYETRLLKPDALLDPEFLMYKRSYPPVVPMMEGVWAYVLGGWDDQPMKWFFLWCWASAGALIYGLLRTRTSILGSVVGMGFWFSLPVSLAYAFGGAISGYGDIPLALGIVAALFVAQTFHRDKRWPAIILMALVMGGVFWVKKEGLPFAAGLMVWLIWRRTAWRTLAATAGVWLLLYAVYKATVLGVPTPFEDDMGVNHSLSELQSRFRDIWGLLVAEMDQEERWGKNLWLIAGLAWFYKFIAVPWRQWFPKELFLFGFMASVYIVVLMLTYYPFEFNLDKLFERLFLHIAPLLIVATFANFDVQVPMNGRDGDHREDFREPSA